MTAWADLSSAARMDAILLAVYDITSEGRGGATAAAIGQHVSSRHPMRSPRMSHNGKAMSLATRVTPGITALRGRGLLSWARRPGDRSGTADALTVAGRARVREIQTARS